MRGLELGVGMGNQRARLAQPKVEVSEKALALPHSEGDLIFLLDKRCQGLSIPHVSSQTEILWAVAQSEINLIELLSAEPTRSAWPYSLNQASKTFFLKAMNPVLNGTWCVAQKVGHLTATHALGHQQQAVKAMVVSRLVRTANFILQCEDNGLGIRNMEFSHVARVPRGIDMRNYLCRCV